MAARLTVVEEENFHSETRGMNYYGFEDLPAISSNNQVLLLKNKRASYLYNMDTIESQHNCPTLLSFNSSEDTPTQPPSHLLVADNAGPIDVIDLHKKRILRSYIEHGSKVTGLTWYNQQSFVSSSSDGTVRLYKSTDRHSHHSFNMFAGTCGACIS